MIHYTNCRSCHIPLTSFFLLNFIGHQVFISVLVFSILNLYEIDWIYITCYFLLWVLVGYSSLCSMKHYRMQLSYKPYHIHLVRQHKLLPIKYLCIEYILILFPFSLCLSMVEFTFMHEFLQNNHKLIQWDLTT